MRGEVALYAAESPAGANRTHGVYGMRSAYRLYGKFSTISYFYGQPYGMVLTPVYTVRFIVLATLGCMISVRKQGLTSSTPMRKGIGV